MSTIERATQASLPEITELLMASGLPTEGVEEHVDRFLVARGDGRLEGSVGIEVYGTVGLLRSLAVRPESRSTGLGRALVEALLGQARSRGLREMYLLTTTADAYFPRFGFETIAREDADPRLHDSEEFRGACPDSAVCMRLRL